MVANAVEHQVVLLSASGEVFFRVVDHAIRADELDQVHVLRAAHSGDVSAERFRNLHRECPDTSRRAVDQDLVAGPDATFVAQPL